MLSYNRGRNRFYLPARGTITVRFILTAIHSTESARTFNLTNIAFACLSLSLSRSLFLSMFPFIYASVCRFVYLALDRVNESQSQKHKIPQLNKLALRHIHNTGYTIISKYFSQIFAVNFKRRKQKWLDLQHS